MVKEFRLYRHFLKIRFLSEIEYKGWWLMFFQVFLATFGDPLAVVLTFSRFGSIGAWTMERILLMYAIAFTSFGLAETLLRGFDMFPYQMVRNGDFDRLLIRPKSLFVQVSASFFHLRRGVRPLIGLVIIFWCINQLGIELTSIDVIMLIFALVGGFLIYAGVFVMSSGIAFFTINAVDWIYIFTSASREAARVPIDYLPRVFRYMFTFFMPMLVISYFPASAIGDWGDAAWRGWLALPAGAAFFVVAMLVWRIGIKHYKSTGS